MKRSLALCAAAFVSVIPGAAAIESDWDSAALEAELRQALATMATAVGDMTVVETGSGIEAAVAELGVTYLGWDVVFTDVVITATAVGAEVIDFDLAFHGPGVRNQVTGPRGRDLSVAFDRASAMGSWSVPMQAVTAFDLTVDRAIVGPPDPDDDEFAMSVATVAVSAQVSASANGDWRLTETLHAVDLHAGISLLTVATVDRLEFLFELAGDDWHGQRGSWRPQAPYGAAEPALPQHIHAALLAGGVAMPIAGVHGTDKLHFSAVWDIPDPDTATAGFSIGIAGAAPGPTRRYVPEPYMGVVPESLAVGVTMERIPRRLVQEMAVASLTPTSLFRFVSFERGLVRALERAGTIVRLDMLEAEAPEGGGRGSGVAVFDADAAHGMTATAQVTLVGLDELIDRVAAARHLPLDQMILTTLQDYGVARRPERGLSVYDYAIEMASDGTVTVNGEVRP